MRLNVVTFVIETSDSDSCEIRACWHFFDLLFFVCFREFQTHRNCLLRITYSARIPLMGASACETKKTDKKVFERFFASKFQMFWTNSANRARRLFFRGLFWRVLIIIRCRIYWLNFGCIKNYKFAPYVKYNLLRAHILGDSIWSDRVQNTRLILCDVWCDVKCAKTGIP